MTISNELLSTILETEIVSNQYDSIRTISVTEMHNANDFYYSEHNIYELSYKCKDYALSKGYILDSQSRGYCRGKGICFVYRDDWTSEFPEHCLESFCEDSEIQSVFRATEWVMNNANKL